LRSLSKYPADSNLSAERLFGAVPNTNLRTQDQRPSLNYFTIASTPLIASTPAMASMLAIAPMLAIASMLAISSMLAIALMR